jgi:hypothetical protein
VLAWTDPINLRRSTAWATYVEDFVLPVIYGRVRIQAKPYDETGRLWFLADHAIAGVDNVSIDNTLTEDFGFQNGTDSTGSPISVLETTVEGIPTVELRGKQENGILLERPDQILAQYIDGTDELRAWSQDTGIICAGVINDDSLSVQSTVDSMINGMGLAWTTETAIPWPSIPDGSHGEINIKSDNVESTAKSSDIVTRLTVNYRFDYATGKPTRSLVMDATQTEYGIRETTVNAPWITDNKSAELLAERYLRWFAAPVWNVSSSIRVNAGLAVDIDHPYSPIARGIVTKSDNSGVTAQGTTGYGKAVGIIRRASGIDAEQEGNTNVVFEDGILTFVTFDAQNRLLSGASVTLDGNITRISGSDGKVAFATERGAHVLVIQAAGHQDQTVPINV